MTVESSPLPSVVHISSHHELHDGRVFYRECQSMAAMGFDLSLVIPHTQDEVVDGVKICAIRRYKNRFERFLIMPWVAVRRARQTGAEIFHFHDPELVFPCLYLRSLGKPVIFDIHEDFAQAALVREWIPGPLRKLAAALYGGLEWVINKSFHIVIAERYYARKFPNSTMVLNYPDLAMFADLLAIDRDAAPLERIRMIYTGSVTASRGAVNHARIASRLPGSELVLVGHCRRAVLDEMIREVPQNSYIVVDEEGGEEIVADAGGDAAIVKIIGLDRYVLPQTIIAKLSEPWSACLAVFPKSEHYFEKELTKFFEYMAAGLPAVASDFPTWQNLVEGHHVGATIPHDDYDAAARKISAFHNDRQAVVELGKTGRRLVADEFNWASQATNLKALYLSLARRR